MHRVLCRQCPQCGLFNDFSVKECECGEYLYNVGVQFIDKHEVHPEQLGEIDISLKAYVQKCSACGALNYTDDPSHPVKVCYNCHKTRIATITPVECVENDAGKEDTSTSKSSDSGVADSPNAQHGGEQIPQKQLHHIDDDDDDDTLDSQTSFWMNIKNGIRNASSGNAQLNICESVRNDTTRFAVERETIETQNNDDEDDDGDVDAGDWSGILGTTHSQESTPMQKQYITTMPTGKSITLTAIRYGRLSFTVKADQNVYMLGRSAKQGDFLSQDGRVGNEHCYLLYKNGEWFVKDNNSSNGTAVNSRDIGLNGECMLSDGDELKLGHHRDSMAFRITIS